MKNSREFVDGSLASQVHHVLALHRSATTSGEGFVLLYPSRPVLDTPADLCNIVAPFIPVFLLRRIQVTRQ